MVKGLLTVPYLFFLDRGEFKVWAAFGIWVGARGGSGI